MLNSLNLYDDACQLFLNKTEKKRNQISINNKIKLDLNFTLNTKINQNGL